MAGAAPVGATVERSELSAPRVAYDAGIALLFTAIAYAQVFVLPSSVPMPGMDSIIFLNAAARMVHGQAIYRDFFELTFPGTALYYATLMKVFGVRAWIPAWTMVALGVGVAWTTLNVARLVLKDEPQALLASLATLAFPVFHMPDATHRWFSTFLVLGATWAALKQSRSAPIVSGVLCGAATFFTQTSGVVAVVIAGWMLGRRRAQDGRYAWRDAVLVLSTFVMSGAAFCGYFVVQAGPRVFWKSTVVFVLKNYGSVWWNSTAAYMSSVPGRSLGGIPDLLTFGLVHGIVPLIYVLFAVRYVRERRHDWNDLMLVEVVGLALLLSVARSASDKRLTMTCIPAVVLLVWFLHQRGAVERVLRRTLWCVTLVALIAGPIMRQRQWHGVVETPTGRVATQSRDLYNALVWLGPRTHPGEASFGHPPLEFLLQLRPATYVPYASPGNYTPPEQVQQVTEALERQHVPLILVSAMGYLPQEDGPDHLAPLRSYIRQNYRVVKVLGATEVWLRKGVELPSMR